MSRFSFAPAAVVRIASWPLDDVTALAAPELAAQAVAIDPHDDEAVAALEARYAAVIESTRARLWQTTAADPRFRAALALSSPCLHERLGERELPAKRNKSARHLETSLYRYLARAASRTEPFGLWTSVALAAFDEGAQTRADPVQARAHLGPELGPYRALLRDLSRRAPYSERGPWRLNPTLRREAGGAWVYARRGAGDGALTWRSIPESVGALLSRALGDRGGSRAELVERLEAQAGPTLALSLIELALEGGLLVGGLALPTRYRDAWQALALAQRDLEGADAQAWDGARRAARRRCQDLAARLDDPSADESPASLAEAVRRVDQGLREQVVTLARRLDLPAPTRYRAWLRCDLAAGWRLRLGQEDRARLERILASWAQLEREHAVGARRRSAAADRLRACPGGVLMAAPRAPGEQVELANVGLADADAVDVGPPLGALVLRPGAGGLETPWLRGLSDVATATHARHAYHLAEREDPLLPWFRQQYRELADEGVEVVDLAYENTGSPNLLARPEYVPRVVAPWSARAQESIGAEARLEQGPRAGSLVVWDDERCMSLHAFTATVAPPTDTVLERLMATSFDDRGRISRGRGVAPDLDAARSLAPTITLEPRRVRLRDEEVAGLAEVRRCARYRRWQRLVESHELPALVRLTIGARPGLLVPTSSPLAMEAAFEGLRADSTITIEEVVERGWLPGPRGRHIAELVVPLRRHDHLWRARPPVSERRSERADVAVG